MASVTAPSSTAAPADRKRGLVSALVAVAGATALVMLVWMFGVNRLDPYSKATLSLSGDVVHGGQLFRINCAGCHGIAGQGLVGPSLQGVAAKRSNRSIIHQIVSGETPPMPRFEIEPQGMADLLSYLKTVT
ncbi:cytochrome c [Synechococcus sp. PROS-7-1]|uniref:c-type cytochrome n=1 Tax=Synechococcus sp. PROS-7-1 TaxID=1442556 RepID=UPI001645E239|nr:cytochrome c [Synechococcus sp. PROS-7-1]